jgi:5-methylcytosine-specific restriction endonuclease McrA
MQDGEKSIKNLKATLRRIADTEADVRWIVDWRTKETLNERRRFAPKGWLEYLSGEALPETKNEADIEVSYVSANIPSSFVSKQMKLANDRGHGESKLYVGPVAKKEEFNLFFLGWHPLNTYEFDHVELLLYLQEVEGEFSRHSKYKAVSKRLYNQLMTEVNRIKDLRVNLSSHTDRSRYYIKGKSEAWMLMRSLAVPLMSELVVEQIKAHEGGYADYRITLVRSEKEHPKSAMSGKRQGSKPRRKRRRSRKPKVGAAENLRAVPQDLKDQVWKRCQGMCQANWRVDSVLDKNSGDICGSNENLEFDHIVPFSRGGKTTYCNLQLLCQKHNRMKSDREV